MQHTEQIHYVIIHYVMSTLLPVIESLRSKVIESELRHFSNFEYTIYKTM